MKKEEMQAKLYKEALHHLNHAKKERLYYRAHAKLANKNYQKMLTIKQASLLTRRILLT